MTNPKNEIIEVAREVYGTTATEQEIRFAKLIAAKYEQKIQDLEDLITELQERQE
jgi:hypothetical protein